MKRTLGLVYGILCYAFFLGVFLRGVWFVWTFDELVPRSPIRFAMMIDTALVVSFAVPHSVMARPGFKRAWAKLVPPALERSTYVLVSSFFFLAVIEFWQPLPGAVWKVRNPAAVILLHTLFWIGWGLIFWSTMMIDHFDFFGLRQVWNHWRNQPYQSPGFRTPALYRWVRHPLYLGFLVAFWSAPTMTSGHLFFAVLCTVYILVGIGLEERDLVTFLGEPYRIYRSSVSMLIPLPGKKMVQSK